MKRLKVLVAAALITGMASTLTFPALAETLNFSKPTYIYGSGLGDDEIRRTGELLGLKSLSNITMQPVTGTDLDRFLGNPQNFTTDGEMISSVVVAKAPKGSGLDVNITTPGNITQIRKYQYENACITAGINDVYVNVGAVRPVTGESALAGIYKAFEVNNVTLDKKRMEVAQKELEVTNKIIQNNIENNTVSNNTTNNNTTVNNNTTNNNTTINNNNTTVNNNNSTNIDNSTNITNIEINQQMINELIIAIKSEVGVKAKEAEKEDKPLSREEIDRIIDEKIKEKNLENTINQEAKTELSNVIEQYSQTDAVKSEDVQKQLDDLGTKVKEDPKQTSSNSSNTIIVPVTPEETTTENETTSEVAETTTETAETTESAETTVSPETTTSEEPELTEDGFTVKRGGSEAVDMFYRHAFSSFQEGTEFIVLTAPEYPDAMKFDLQKASDIKATPETEKYLPVNEDVLGNIGEPGFSADYYDGEKYIGGTDLAVYQDFTDYINVRSAVNETENGPDLSPFAKEMFSAYTGYPENYFEALVKEMKGNEDKVGVLQAGDQFMVLKFRNDTADAYLLSRDTSMVLEPNIKEFERRYLNGNAITLDPDEPSETTVEEKTTVTTSSPETTKEEISVIPEEKTTEEIASEEEKTTESIAETTKITTEEAAGAEETSEEASEETTIAEPVQEETTEGMIIPETSETTEEETTTSEVKKPGNEKKNIEELKKELGKTDEKPEDLLRKKYILINNDGKEIKKDSEDVMYVEFRDGKLYSNSSLEGLMKETDGREITEKAKDTVTVKMTDNTEITVFFTKDGFLAVNPDGTYNIYRTFDEKAQDKQ